jgi:quercetin dioxygenase-like cupin family protein
MTDGKVEVFRSGEGNVQTAQTPGMQREELVSTPDAWVGMVQTRPGFTSGWHHHGKYDTYVYVISGQLRFEFGKDGKESCLAREGEVAFIPKNTVHRESNPGAEQQLLFGVRVGAGAPVFNVDGPAV